MKNGETWVRERNNEYRYNRPRYYRSIPISLFLSPSHFSTLTGETSQTLPDMFSRIPTLRYLCACESFLQTHTTSSPLLCFFSLISRLLSLFCIRSLTIPTLSLTHSVTHSLSLALLALRHSLIHSVSQ